MTDDELDRVFKALGDPTRRRILDHLRDRPGLSLFEICALLITQDGMAHSRQAVTQHLSMLERAGLIRIGWSGRTRTHQLCPDILRNAAGQWLCHHLQEGSLL